MMDKDNLFLLIVSLCLIFIFSVGYFAGRYSPHKNFVKCNADLQSVLPFVSLSACNNLNLSICNSLLENSLQNNTVVSAPIPSDCVNASYNPYNNSWFCSNDSWDGGNISINFYSMEYFNASSHLIFDCVNGDVSLPIEIILSNKTLTYNFSSFCKNFEVSS